MNQVKKCPVIHRKLKSYRRQYFGYIDKYGDKIIYTTFNRDSYILFDKLFRYNAEDNEKWKKEKEMVLDGCSYHWEIKINLETAELFELGVNGLASNENESKKPVPTLTISLLPERLNEGVAIYKPSSMIDKSGFPKEALTTTTTVRHNLKL